MDTPDLAYFLSLARLTFCLSSRLTLPSLSFPSPLLFFFLCLLYSHWFYHPVIFSLYSAWRRSPSTVQVRKALCRTRVPLLGGNCHGLPDCAVSVLASSLFHSNREVAELFWMHVRSEAQPRAFLFCLCSMKQSNLHVRNYVVFLYFLE